MGIELLPDFICENYEVHEWKHACAILKSDFPKEFQDIIDLLTSFRLQRNHIEEGGGRKSKVANRIDSFL